MLTIRRADERGAANHGWLDTRHTFSFASYHDPAHMGFRALRVLNEDRVTPGQGFGTHGHRDMEILSFVLDGALAHRDSTGTEGVITPGDVQGMSAGTGVMHSEFNASATAPVHFLQVWLMPDEVGVRPSYHQKRFEAALTGEGLPLVASPDGRDGSLTIHTDARVYFGTVLPGRPAEVTVEQGRHAYVHVATGAVTVNGQRLGAGDGARLSEVDRVTVEGEAAGGSRVLVFDLA